MPVRARFAVDDYVYLRRRNVVNTLQTEARPTILRVLRVMPSGVLHLQGRCGGVTKVNAAECAPCHLSGINPVLDPTLRKPGEEFPCELCGSPDDEASMLICDGCLKGYHLHCLQPPLSAVPEEEIWVCPQCLQRGVTVERLTALRQLNMPVAASDAAIFPSVAQRTHDAAAQQLQGEVVWVRVAGQGGGSRVRAVLEYVPRVDRGEHSRCPLRAVAGSRTPVYMSLRQAQKLVLAGPPEGTMALSDGLAAVFVAESGSPVPRASHLSPGMDRGQAAAALLEWSGVAPSEQLLDAYMAAAVPLLGELVGEDLGITGEQGVGLMKVVDLRWCSKLAVVGGPAAELLQAYRLRYGKVFWDKLPGKAADQLSTSWYKQLHQKLPLDWVFLRPGPGLLEMALGLAVQQARKGVAALVQRSALSDGSSVLAAMLQRWEGEQRLVCVSRPTCTLVWLVVFASAHVEQAMVSVRGRVLGSDWVLGSWR
jgi:hypothetical protein